MRVNALLVRWAKGFNIIYDAAGEAEAGRTVYGFLEAGNAQSLDEATRIAEAEFDRFASEQVAFTLTVDTRNGPVPYADYGIGDTVLLPNIEAGTTTERVTGMTVAEDDEGTVLYSPEVGAQPEDTEVRVLRWLERMAPGTLGGRSERASPFRGYPTRGAKSVRKDRVVASFYDAEPAVGSASGPWEFERAVRVVEIVANAEGFTGTTLSTYDLLHDGVVFDSISISAGQSRGSLFVDESFASGDIATVDTDVNGGHTKVTIQFLRDP